MGRKSSRIFMRDGSQWRRGAFGFLCLAGFKVQRSRVHAIAQAAGGRAIIEDMAQMRPALCTYRFRAQHAVAAVCDAGDRARDGLAKARPAAAGVEFAVRVEQLGAAADAVVAAIAPVGLVVAGKGALGGGMARYLQGHRLGAFGVQDGLPLGVGFLDGGIHDEQRMAMVAAQSGGKAAEASCPGCSPQGRSSSRKRVSMAPKSPCCAARMACSPIWLRSTNLGLVLSIMPAICA